MLTNSPSKETPVEGENSKNSCDLTSYALLNVDMLTNSPPKTTDDDNDGRRGELKTLVI